MGYLVLFSITLLLIISIAFKKNLLIKYFLIIIFILIIIFPEETILAAKEGINLWLFTLAPSLLPFFIVNDILISLEIPENISKLFTKMTNILFKTSGYGAYVFIMSIFTGYPSGAKTISELIKEKKISKEEGQMILTFSSTSGPLFIIGTVGAGMLKSPYLGYIIYVAHIIGAILNGVLYRFVYRPRIKNLNDVIYKKENKSVGDMFTNGIVKSFTSMGLIGGYVILFSVILSLLNRIGLFIVITEIISTIFKTSNSFSYLISNLLQSIFEITNGCRIISISSINILTKLYIISFIIAFSGLSIIGQVTSILGDSKINITKYIMSKITHGLFSSISTFLIIKMSKLHITTSTNYKPLYIPTTLTLVQLMLVLLFIINFISMFRTNKKRTD